MPKEVCLPKEACLLGMATLDMAASGTAHLSTTAPYSTAWAYSVCLQCSIARLGAAGNGSDARTWQHAHTSTTKRDAAERSAVGHSGAVDSAAEHGVRRFSSDCGRGSAAEHGSARHGAHLRQS